MNIINKYYRNRELNRRLINIIIKILKIKIIIILNIIKIEK